MELTAREGRCLSKAISLSTRIFFTTESIYEHGRGVLPIASASASGRARTEWNGNRTEMHWWCAGDRTTNGRARVPFRRNGTERKFHRFYGSYCMLNYVCNGTVKSCSCRYFVDSRVKRE